MREDEGVTAAPFVPPPYPYDRLDELKAVAARHDGGVVDLSIGTPCDPPPDAVVAALASSGSERGYPGSIGACVGTKELVAGIPHWLRLRRPDLDTVLYPAIAYPSYEMGAILAGCRAVPVPVDERWSIDLSAIDPADAERALCLWVNSPGNPAGGLDDLVAAAEWGRAHGVPVLSDECYAEFTWDGPPRSILEAGPDGVLAVHSLSKRSNLAGARSGFYAGDAELVHYLREVRKHAGLMMPGPVQAASVVAFDDDAHVDTQRERYRRRLDRCIELLREAFGLEVEGPRGGFYLWVQAPGGDAWGFTRRLAEEAGALVSPGEFYGPDGATYVRLAVVQPDEQLDLVAQRLSARS
jgi:aspartate/methionine/tyrosine aminotransferase